METKAAEQTESYLYPVRLVLPNMDIGITKISSKGQVVIPEDMREGLKEGDRLVVIKSHGQMILKSAKAFGKKFLEDIEFARRTEEAYKQYEKGKFRRMSYDKFLKELERW